jgi:hypothetical protein
LEGKWSGHEVQYAIEKASGLIRPIGPGDILMTGMRNLDHIDGYK